MHHLVGIWIDHERAVIVSASVDQVATEIVESEVRGHPRYPGQEVGGEKKYEKRHGQELDRYYDQVIRSVPESDDLLVFGPGEAKFELAERFRRSKPHSHRSIVLETADKLTDPQIVASVKAHFDAASRSSAAAVPSRKL